MKYYLFPLSKEEHITPANKGYRYALENKSKWVDLGEVKDEVDTYDKGTTVLVYKNVVYNIFKDYVNIDEKYRVYIGCDLDMTYDRLTEPEEDAFVWNSTDNNHKVPTPRNTKSGEKISDAIESLNGMSGTINLGSGTYSDDFPKEIPYMLTINGAQKNVIASTGARAVDTIDSTESVISGKIALHGESYVVMDGLTFTKNAVIDLNDFEGNLTIRNSKFIGITNTTAKDNKYAFKMDEKSIAKLTITGCYFSNSPGIYNGLELVGELIDGSTFSRNKFTESFCSHNAINIYDVCDNAHILISNNDCPAVNMLRVGIKGEPACTLTFSGNTQGKSTDPTLNSNILVQPYGVKTTSFRNCHLKFTNTSEEYDPYVIVAYQEGIDTELTKDKMPTVSVNGKAYKPKLIVI